MQNTIYYIIGEQGAGKTTLARLLAGEDYSLNRQVYKTVEQTVKIVFKGKDVKMAIESGESIAFSSYAYMQYADKRLKKLANKLGYRYVLAEVKD